jgi:hypothetical protein
VFSNPTGSSLEMALPLRPQKSLDPFGNYPVKDRTPNM